LNDLNDMMTPHIGR